MRGQAIMRIIRKIDGIERVIEELRPPISEPRIDLLIQFAQLCVLI